MNVIAYIFQTDSRLSNEFIHSLSPILQPMSCQAHMPKTPDLHPIVQVLYSISPLYAEMIHQLTTFILCKNVKKNSIFLLYKSTMLAQIKFQKNRSRNHLASFVLLNNVISQYLYAYD